MNNTSTNTVYVKKESSGWKWFFGIVLVLIFIGLLMVAGSFLIFSSAVTNMDTGDYYYETTGGSGSERIAVVDLDFTIISSESIVRQFKKYAKDDRVKAIILRINSPGGGVAASQEMYEIIRRTRDGGKPVIVSMGSIAASGGYYSACGSSYIFANPGTLTGSIGVIINLMSFKELAEKIGIKETTIKSGELKDAGNPFKVLTEKDSLYFQDIINNSFQQFFDVVATERHIDRERLKEIANGRVFTGSQALELGLVDKLGTFDDAVKYAADLVGIEGDPPLVRERRRKGFFTYVIEGLTHSEFDDIKQEVKEEYIDAPLLQYKFVK
ncbi:MAG: signal peptide peptidase SppA [Ignavibacteriae bacterium]|nr:signal peptide peptidase SppA [Ignavibacteriota bacterium]